MPQITLAKKNIPPFIAGKDYEIISREKLQNETIKNFLAKDPQKIQVLSFFNYACYGCSLIQQPLEKWVIQKGKKIKFYRIPVIFHPSWRNLAKMYYVLEESNQLSLGKKLFKAIHFKRENLYTKSALREFYVASGGKSFEFNNLMDSFLVEQRIVYAMNLVNHYGVTISPSVILNTPRGSFFISTITAGSERRFFKVMDYLLKKQGAT